MTMAISARLNYKTQRALARYCKTHGLTKTEALERGIELLLQTQDRGTGHPAWTAFQRLRIEGAQDTTESVDALKRHLDEKYPA